MIRTELQEVRQRLPGNPTATVLAEKARMSHGQFSMIERGEVRPGPKTRARMAKVLGLTPEEFDRLCLLARRDFLERELERVMALLAPASRKVAGR